MSKIKIMVDSKTGQTYLPRHIREDGFIGKIEGLANAMTFTLFKPRADLSEIEASLTIILQDIALRRQQEERMRKDRRLTNPPVKRERCRARIHEI